MTDKRTEDELTPEELEETNGEPLPDREAMSVIGDPSQWNMPPVFEPADPGATLPVEPPATE
jgi:hypothetical protein